MRRIAALLGLWCGVVLLCFAVPVDAKNICSCTCFDREETTSLLRAGTSLDACKADVCPAACEGVGSTQESDETSYNPSTNRCACACKITVKKLQYTNLTSGNTQCLGDCSVKCGGQANVFQDETTPKIVDAACVPGSALDCKVGAYAKYEGITCALRPTIEQGWPNGKPACILPVNTKNANLECQNTPGITKGGTCGFIGSGENPNSYFKTRPFFNVDGTYGIREFKEDYPTLTVWQDALDLEYPLNGRVVPQGAGICYQLGILYGGVPPAPEGEGSGGLGGFQVPLGSVPENDYVCLKKKTDLCGHLSVPIGSLVNTPASGFRCQRTVDYLAQYSGKSQQFVNETCLPESGTSPDGKSYADSCVQLGYRCCPSRKAGSCQKDADCSLDHTKTCKKDAPNTGLFDYGTCVWNPVCDAGHNADVTAPGVAPIYQSTPWLVDIRRCRSAQPTEIADPSICSGEIPLPGQPNRCPGVGQACCRPQNTKAISGCALDKAFDAGPGSIWNDFACLDEGGLPSAEYVVLPTGRQLRTLVEAGAAYTGGNCLPPTVPQYVQGGGLKGGQLRCSAGKVCCNSVAIAKEGGEDYKAGLLKAQKADGAKCGEVDRTTFNCLAKKTVGPDTEAEAQAQGFVSMDQYFEHIARSNYCNVTPLEPGGSIYQNQECHADHLCCWAGLQSAKTCVPSDSNADELCNAGTGCSDTNPDACMKCDPETSLCVNAGLFDKATASDLCFIRSQAAGDQGAKEIGKINDDPEGKTFSCQFVSPETPGILERCVGFGCDEFASGAPSGKTAACCVPGIGETPAAAAQGAVGATIEPQSGPFGLALPACIAAGNCTLDDIVATGANFANFLIGISGSVFLAIFVYGGFQYLTAGSSDRAAKGKKMIIQATFAMVLIMGAFIFVSFIQSSLVGGAAGSTTKATCGQTDETKGYSCTFLKTPAEKKKEFDEEVSTRNCKKQLCPGPANYLCCPS